MSEFTWGDLPKNQTDNQLISQAIDQAVQAHDDDPDSHLEIGQSLQSHKASEIIDHVAESVVNDKIKSIARASTAIVKIPATHVTNNFFRSIAYTETSLTVVGGSLTPIEICSRLNTAGDVNYFYNSFNGLGSYYFEVQSPLLSSGQKLYRIRVKIRAKFLNPTGSDFSFSLLYGDGEAIGFTGTSSFANYTTTLYFLQKADDSWSTINQETLDAFNFGISNDSSGFSSTHNQLAISQFYIEADAIDLSDQEDFSYLGDALNYVNSLGGGNIYIANGTYTMPYQLLTLNGNVRITGQSPYGVNLNFPDIDEFFRLGNINGIIYQTGTVTFTNGSANITGSGTTWTTLNTVGHYILEKRSGRFYKIIARNSNTSITVDKVYRGQTSAGNTYIIKDLVSNNILENFTTNGRISLYGTLDCSCIGLINNTDSIDVRFAENVILDSCTLNGVSVLLQMDYVFNSSWINCYFINASQTVLYFTINSRYNLVFNCLFSDCSNQCIITFGNGLIAQNNIIVNCGFSLGSGFSAILMGSTSFENTISGNQITFSGNNGIGSQTGANFNLVIGNILRNNSVAGIVNVGANSVTSGNIAV